MAVDRAGNLVIADTGNSPGPGGGGNGPARFYGQAMTAGDIYTVAGNGRGGSPATGARPPAPSSRPRRAWRWTAPGTW